MKYSGSLLIFISISFASYGQRSAVDSLNLLIKRPSPIEAFRELPDIQFSRLIDFIGTPKLFLCEVNDAINLTVRTEFNGQTGESRWKQWEIAVGDSPLITYVPSAIHVETVEMEVNNPFHIIIRWTYKETSAYGSREIKGIQVWDVQNAVNLLDAITYKYYEQRVQKDWSGAKPTEIACYCEQPIYVKDKQLFIEKGRKYKTPGDAKITNADIAGECNLRFLPAGQYGIDKTKWVTAN